MEHVSGWLHKSETTQGRTGCESSIFLSASGSCKLRGVSILTQSICLSHQLNRLTWEPENG